jgi:tetratricopeptide (TPR) repeat protein
MRTGIEKSFLHGILYASLFLIALVHPVVSQHAGHASPGGYGPAVNTSILPPPPLMTGIGTSHIPITTNSTQAQKYFDQGVNLLHCFWDVEAYRAFKEAARLDGSAPMAYWGIYTALAQNPSEMADERSAALKKAVELMPSASDREKYYIRAISLLAGQGKGRPAWISEMEALIDKYPEDVEAKLFLANSLSSSASSYGPDGRPRDGKLYGQAILRNLLGTHPEHAAVHHYWIHAQENGPRPQDALASAEKLPKLVPNSGHMLHMPGHIYYKLGDYEKARKHFLDSMRVDLAYMKAQNMNPINNWNFVHNLDYLVANCAEEGRYEEAARHAGVLGAIPSDESRLKANGLSYIVWGGHTALTKLQMRYGFWDEAIRDLSARVGDGQPDTLPLKYQSALISYLRGMGAIEKGDLDGAAGHLEALEAATGALAGQKPIQGSDWYFNSANRTLPVFSQDLKGSLQSAQGRHEEAIKLLLDTVERERNLGYWEPPHYTRPALESLALAYTRAGKYGKAVEAYEDLLKLRPNTGFAYLGMARVYAREGKKEKAAESYRRFLDAWKNADKGLPQLAEAGEYLKNNK